MQEIPPLNFGEPLTRDPSTLFTEDPPLDQPQQYQGLTCITGYTEIGGNVYLFQRGFVREAIVVAEDDWLKNLRRSLAQKISQAVAENHHQLTRALVVNWVWAFVQEEMPFNLDNAIKQRRRVAAKDDKRLLLSLFKDGGDAIHQKLLFAALLEGYILNKEALAGEVRLLRHTNATNKVHSWIEYSYPVNSGADDVIYIIDPEANFFGTFQEAAADEQLHAIYNSPEKITRPSYLKSKKIDRNRKNRAKYYPNSHLLPQIK